MTGFQLFLVYLTFWDVCRKIYVGRIIPSQYESSGDVYVCVCVCVKYCMSDLTYRYRFNITAGTWNLMTLLNTVS